MISADELKRYLDFAIDAYQNHNLSGQEYRQDGKVPYVMHPLWCASIFVSDTRIPYEEREKGFKAFILHDVLEDTSQALPDWVEPEVAHIVHELTFESAEQALKAVYTKPINIKLLLLIDALSSMYEEHVMPNHRSAWKKVSADLLKEVEEHYGNIRVVQIAKAILDNTDW